MLSQANESIRTSERESSRRITSQRFLSIANIGRLPKKVGSLKKFSPAFFKRWQSRLIELDEGTLKYFKETRRGKLENKGTLNFDLYWCQVS